MILPTVLYKIMGVGYCFDYALQDYALLLAKPWPKKRVVLQRVVEAIRDEVSSAPGVRYYFALRTRQSITHRMACVRRVKKIVKRMSSSSMRNAARMINKLKPRQTQTNPCINKFV